MLAARGDPARLGVGAAVPGRPDGVAGTPHAGSAQGRARRRPLARVQSCPTLSPPPGPAPPCGATANLGRDEGPWRESTAGERGQMKAARWRGIGDKLGVTRFATQVAIRAAGMGLLTLAAGVAAERQFYAMACTFALIIFLLAWELAHHA